MTPSRSASALAFARAGADPDFTDRDYEKWSAYGQAKTATALLAIALADRYGSEGIAAAAVRPGVIKTDLQRHLGEEEEQQVLAMPAEQGDLRSVEATLLWHETIEALGRQGV